MYLVGGAITGLLLAVLNPLVTAQGDTVLWQGPEIPILDLEITLQEIASGLAAGVRVFAVAVLVGAILGHVDGDRLLARASRLAPRSAMLVSLAARMLPSLERDARRLHEAAQLRGLDLSSGPRLRRAREAAALAVPLVGSSLERGLDVAEAMAARGFGSGTRTHVRERAWDAVEWAVLLLGAGLAVVAGLAIAGAAPYSYFPLLDPVLTPAALAMAGSAAALLGGAWWALRR
jgi:energy-coupling factor transport system permease protein